MGSATSSLSTTPMCQHKESPPTISATAHCSSPPPVYRHHQHYRPAASYDDWNSVDNSNNGNSNSQQFVFEGSDEDDIIIKSPPFLDAFPSATPPLNTIATTFHISTTTKAPLETSSSSSSPVAPSSPLRSGSPPVEFKSVLSDEDRMHAQSKICLPPIPDQPAPRPFTVNKKKKTQKPVLHVVVPSSRNLRSHELQNRLGRAMSPIPTNLSSPLRHNMSSLFPHQYADEITHDFTQPSLVATLPSIPGNASSYSSFPPPRCTGSGLSLAHSL